LTGRLDQAAGVREERGWDNPAHANGLRMLPCEFFAGCIRRTGGAVILSSGSRASASGNAKIGWPLDACAG